MKYQLKMFRDASGNAYYRIVDSKGNPVDPTQVEYDYNTDSYRITEGSTGTLVNYGKGYQAPTFRRL
jgi:hypothetical protein